MRLTLSIQLLNVQLCNYQIASSSWDSTTKIFNIQNPKSEHTLIGHKGSIYSTLFSKDGKKVITSSSDNSVKIWEWESDTSIVQSIQYQSEVQSTDLSQCQNYIISGTGDSMIHIFDLKRQQIYKKIQNGKGIVYSVKFKPNSIECFAAGSSVGILNYICVNEPEDNFSKTAISGGIKSLEFNYDGTYILTGSMEGQALLWDVLNKSISKIYNKNCQKLTAVKFNLNQTLIQTSDLLGQIKVYDLNSTVLVKRYKLSKNGMGITSFDFVKDEYVVVGMLNGFVGLQNIENGQLIQSYEGHDIIIDKIIVKQLDTGDKDNFD